MLPSNLAPLQLTCSHLFFFSSRRRHTRSDRDWSSDVCSSDLLNNTAHRSVIVMGCVFIKIETQPITITERWAVLFKRLNGNARFNHKLSCRDEIGRASCRERV